MTKEAAQKIVNEANEKLGEYFEGVTILVTWDEGDFSEKAFASSGNWFMNYGLIMEHFETSRFKRQAAEIAKNGD